MRWIGTVTVAGLLAGGLAMAQAQKPAPLEAPPRGAPGGKSQAAPPTPGTPQGGKFAAPPASPAPPQAGPGSKGAPPTDQAAPQSPAPPPQAATPPDAPSPGPLAEVPANEPEAVTRLRRLLDADARLSYGSAQTIDPATGSVRLTEVVVTRPGNRRMTMAELTLGGLRDDGVGEALARELTMSDDDATVTLARLQLAGLTVRRPAPGEEFRPDQLSLDTLRLEGLRVRAKDGTEVSLADTTLEEYGPGRQGRLALAGLDVRPPAGEAVEQVRLGRMALRGFDMAGMLAALVAKEAPPRPTGRYAVEAEDLAVGTASRPMGGMASLRLAGEAGGPTETGTLAVRGVRVEPFPGLETWLRRFGYQALLLDLTAEGRYEPQSGRLNVSSISLAGRDIGALALSYVVDGLTPEATQNQDYSAVRLISASLRYADQSLLARVVRQQAREAGVPEQRLREQYATMAAGALTQPGQGAGLDAIRDAVLRFIRGQAQELAITARPPQPVAITQLQAAPPGSAAEAQRLFGLSATAR